MVRPLPVLPNNIQGLTRLISLSETERSGKMTRIRGLEYKKTRLGNVDADQIDPNGLSVNDYENQINVLKTELKEIQENINRMVRIRGEILQNSREEAETVAADGRLSPFFNGDDLNSSGSSLGGNSNSNSGNISESNVLRGGKKKSKRKTKTKTKKTKKTRKNKTRRQRRRKV